MAIYDYKCLECGTIFEAFNKIDTRQSAQCSTCKGTALQQVAAPRFKLDQSFPGYHLKWGRDRKKLNNDNR